MVRAGWLGTNRYRAAGGSTVMCSGKCQDVERCTAGWLYEHAPVACGRRLSISKTVMCASADSQLAEQTLYRHPPVSCGRRLSISKTVMCASADSQLAEQTLYRHAPVSCDRRLSVSITVMSGEDTLSSASASGTARLRAGECSENVPREALSRYGWVAGGHVPP